MSAIQFDQIFKTFKSGFKKSQVLSDITFGVGQGEIFGFLGPNGAGKSTSIKLLMNFIRPTSGRIFVKGLPVDRDNFKQHIGYLPEMPCFYENLTGMETLWFAGKASGMKKPDLDERAQTVLQRLKLDHAKHARVRTYSKGMKQRLGIAVALIHDPEILILDEPMSGLDPMGRKLITDVILELRDKGKTVFFSSHILSDIERMCNRIAIINKGRLLSCSTVEEVIRNHAGVEEAFIHFIETDNRSSRPTNE